MATAKLKRKCSENPDSQKSSLIKLLILKKCSFASSFVSLHMGTCPRHKTKIKIEIEID